MLSARLESINYQLCKSLDLTRPVLYYEFPYWKPSRAIRHLATQLAHRNLTNDVTPVHPIPVLSSVRFHIHINPLFCYANSHFRLRISPESVQYCWNQAALDYFWSGASSHYFRCNLVLGIPSGRYAMLMECYRPQQVEIDYAMITCMRNAMCECESLQTYAPTVRCLYWKWHTLFIFASIALLSKPY